MQQSDSSTNARAALGMDVLTVGQPEPDQRVPPDCSHELRTIWLGRQGYDEAHAHQRRIRDRVVLGQAPPTLLLLEHGPVITLGRRWEAGDVRVPFDELAQRGIALREVERGGKATYHGPGQLVGYLVAPVRQLAPDLPTYVWRIEEALLPVVTGYDVRASRDPRNHGLWVGDAKLAFIGIAVHRGVAWHGFALNVEPDLSAFDLIRPCGLDVAVTALAAHVSPVPHVEAVAGEAARRVAEVFGLIQAPVASALW